VTQQPRRGVRLGTMRILVLALMAALGAGACSPSLPSLAEQQRATVALERSFGVLGELGVTFYENSKDCRRLEYERGVFVEDEGSITECSSRYAAQAFDEVASADFEKVRAVLVTDDVAATGIAQTRYADGRLLGAWFEVRTLLGYLTYYYEASGSPPMDWDTDTSAANQVSDHWWFAIWN